MGSRTAARRVSLFFAVYDIGLLALFVLTLPYFLFQKVVRGRAYAPLAARSGRLSPAVNPDGTPSIWVHAVSVGEVLASRGLLAEIKRRFPDRRLVVSTTTVAGQELAQRGLPGVDAVFYAPVDSRGAVRRALDRVNPSLLVLMETELWPNLIHAARRRGTRIAVVNGRLSPRSFPRYRAIRPLLRPLLAEVDLYLMQAEPHAERARAIGAPAERVNVSGNLKYDVAEPAAPDPALAGILEGRHPVWVAGSTVGGEEEIVLAAFRNLREQAPGARLVLAPRHPERFDVVAQLVEADGLRSARRSLLNGGTPAAESIEVLVLDTIGELASVFGHARVAFIGGSLVPRGGHNVLEAAAAGCPVIVGPHMENFQEIASEFLGAGALVQVRDAEDLVPALLTLWNDPARRQEVGQRGRRLLERNRGAIARTADALAGLLAS
jgi:3-deoxy-D-manno-octulosonic-acid transferase